MGRKYGLHPYGSYSYDKISNQWLPAVGGETEIWEGLPVIWPPPPEQWGPIATAPTEIWIPIRPPLTG